MQVSLYKNTFSKEFYVYAPSEVFAMLLNGTFEHQIMPLRTLDAAQYKVAKKQLPAVTWSGVFKEGTREAAAIVTYSKLVILDIDKLEPSNIELLKSQLAADPYVHFCFISPSGKGIKIVIKVNTEAENHLSAFLHLQKTFEDKYLFKVDDSGKDVCRLCYVSHDDRSIYNPKSEVFEVDTRYGEVAQYTPNPALQNYKPTGDLNNIYAVCTKWVNNKKTYQDGEKNIYIHAMACALNRCGVTVDDAINLITMNLPTPDTLWHQSVKGAYFHYQHEHATVLVRDLNNGDNATFVAPPYVANYTEDVVANDLMRITAMLFYQKVQPADIQDILWKIARYYNKEGFIDINRASLADLMNRALYVLNQQVANHEAQTALKYETAENLGRELVKMDLHKGLIKTYIQQIDDGMYGGMMPGNFYGLIGLGGTYKSIIAENIAYKNALDDVPTLYLNGEMSSFQFYERLALMAFGIDLRSELYHKRISEDNIEGFIHEMKLRTKENIFLYNGSGFNRQNILSTVKHIEATTGKVIRLIVADGVTQFDSKGKEEIQATIFNAGECKEIAKETKAVVIGLLHMSGDAGAATLRDTGVKVRGGIKTTANMDGYFSTSKLIDPITSSLENTDEILYIPNKVYLRLQDKRTRAGVIPTIIDITPNLNIEQEMCDPRSYEFNPNSRR